MDAQSEIRLALLAPVFAAKVRAAAAQLEQAGTFIFVVSGLRNAVQQDALYAQGRTTPGHIVTNAKAGLSMHNYGLAADIAPFRQGQNGALNWTTSTPQFREMVSALKEQGLTWGGDWIHFPDMDHFQLGGLPNTPNSAMIADYHANPENLQPIWDKVAANAYA